MPDGIKQSTLSSIRQRSGCHVQNHETTLKKLKRINFLTDKKVMPFRFQFIKFIGLLMIAILCNQAMASDCKEVRLDSPGKSMARIPVMDQDSKWICYAYTASQMVDAWRFSHGDTDFSHITSPIAAAVFYTSQQNSSAQDIDYGSHSDTIASIAKNGSCNNGLIYSKFGQNGLKEYFGDLKKYFDEFQVLAYQKSFSSEKTDLLAQNIQCHLQKSVGIVPTIRQIASALSQPAYIKYLEDLFKPVCSKNSKKVSDIPEANVLYAKDIPKNDRIRKIQEHINQKFSKNNPQPFGIGYCENVLWNKSTVGVTSGGEINWKSCESNHASVIIGQRPTSNGKCEYLIRNSYGQSCNAYPDWKCEKGQIWVDSESLINNLVRLSWLEDK